MNARVFHQQQNSNRRCLQNLGLAGEAEGIAVPSSPMSALQLRQQAEAKAQMGDCAAAIAILSQLMSQNRASAVDYNNRGLMYFEIGQLEKAIADYNRALELNPELSQAYNNRGNCHAALGMRVEATIDYDMAIENFDMALGIGQLEGHIYAERGRTYHVMGEWNAAIADYRRALDILAKPAVTAEASRRLQALVQNWIHQLLGSSAPDADPS